MPNRIKELRKEKGLTLDQFSEAIKIPRATISRYENENSEPKLETWKKLADYFDVSVGYLQGISKYKNIDNGYGVLASLTDMLNASNDSEQEKINAVNAVTKDFEKKARERFQKELGTFFYNSPDKEFMIIASDIISNNQLTNDTKNDLSKILNVIDTTLKKSSLSDSDIVDTGNEVKNMIVSLLQKNNNSSPDTPTNKG